MKIKYTKKAVKYIESLDIPTKQRIKAGIEGLTENPKDNARIFRW